MATPAAAAQQQHLDAIKQAPGANPSSDQSSGADVGAAAPATKQQAARAVGYAGAPSSPVAAAASGGVTEQQQQQPLNEDGPFAASQRKLSAMPEDMEYAPHADRGTAAGPRRRGLCACCFGRGGAVAGEDDGAGSAGGSHLAGLSDRPLGSRLSGGFRSSMKRLSVRHSGMRSLKTLGSHAYSDVEWFDALSRVDSRDQGDLADLDRMAKDASSGAAWVPSPALLFAPGSPAFLPFPLDVSRFCGIWERDPDRTTPPPQPVDVMLKVSWLVMKVHDSVMHVQFKEVDNQFIMVAKPGFAPPGMPCYSETFQRLALGEASWMLRRDLRPGRSFGQMFMMADGTLVLRVRTRPMRGGEYDVITEEYMRLENGGNTLVARQCCMHVPSGKKAVQYLVGHRCATPPKGW